MQTFRIIVAYDGTDFHGWQIQPNAQTISSYLQKTFLKVFGEEINILGASRTDAGVHALGQVARFKCELNLLEERMLKTWNGSLPKSILIRKLEKVGPSFHPHKNVAEKVYLYHLFLKRPLPFVARYGWYYKFIDLVDISKLEKALQLYVGEHDFRSFCKVEDCNKSTIRAIKSISVKKISQGKKFIPINFLGNLHCNAFRNLHSYILSKQIFKCLSQFLSILSDGVSLRCLG